MKTRRIAFSVVTIIYLLTAGFFGWKTYENGQSFKEYRTEVAKNLDLKQRGTDWKEYVDDWTNLTKLFDRSNSEKAQEALDSSILHYDEAVFYGWIIAGISALYFLVALFLFRGTTRLCRNLSLSLTVIAFIFLMIGISVPMMEIGFYTDFFNVPLKGSVLGYDIDLSTKFNDRSYAFYQNKSVIDVIILLFSQSNIVVGAALLLFSVITPVIKLGFTLIKVFYPQNKNKMVSFVVDYLGKWSMADVFVVSVLLAFLSVSNISAGIQSTTQILFGLYFFISFVVISLISGMLLKISAKREKDTVIIN